MCIYLFQGVNDIVPASCCVLLEKDPKNPVPKDNGKCQQAAKEKKKKSDFLNTVVSTLYSSIKSNLTADNLFYQMCNYVLCEEVQT